jgi:AbiV family abortive infection protein
VGAGEHRVSYEVYSACLSNAEALLEEAELLFEHEHYARAFALAFTSYEEVGKSQVAADHLHGQVSDEVYQKSFTDHTLKAAYVVRNLVFPGPEFVYNKAAFKDLFGLRLSAMYVDVDEKEAPLLPSRVVSEDDARHMIDAVVRELSEIENAVLLNGRIGSKGLFK